MERNPYEPPKSALDKQGGPSQELDLAPRGLRFVNLVVDFMAQVLTAAILFAIVGAIDPDLMKRMAADEMPLNDYIIGICVSLLYYVPQESLCGWTLGKLVTRTRVVHESGKPVTFGRVFGRTLLRFVPFEAFTFLAGRGVGLHDGASGTRVVRKARSL